MKTFQRVLEFALTLFFICLYTNKTVGQSITIVPGQDFSNYLGDPIIYKDGLYIKYQTNKNYLAKANGKSISVITNPDDGIGYAGYPIIFNDKLYIAYQSSTVAQLAVYDGTSINLIANPPNTVGYFGFPIVYNNKLYLEYKNTSTTFQLYQFDGNTFKTIDNPTGTTLYEINFSGTESNYDPIIFKSKLYLAYLKTGGNDIVKLGEFDGTNLSILDFLSNDGYSGSPVVYNNKLCFGYTGGSGYDEYDGINPFKSIPLAKASNNFQGVAFNSEPIIFNNKLYVHCVITGSNNLGQFDGDSLRIIPNPDGGLGYGGNPAINDNKLYFGYVNALKQTLLGQYNDTSISLISNPPRNLYDNKLASYHNDLYLGYAGNPSSYKYNGDTLTPVTDANGQGFDGLSIIYHDTLFFADEISISQANNHLAYIGNAVLPIQLLDFSVALQQKNCLITWQTATETNTNYFNIQRSNDGVNFTTINKIAAATSSSSLRSYLYTDVGVTELNLSRLYYRLQEVDKDGASIYSNIKTVDFSKLHSLFSVSPNPAKSFINITSSVSVTDAQITITNMNGKALFTTKQSLIAGQQLKVLLSQFPSEVLILNIKSTNSSEQFKIIKE